MSENRLISTPCYLYDLNLLADTLESVRNASEKYGFRVHYAIKANNNPVITEMIREWGFGVDCVSGNEVAEALHRGFDPSGIVFAGVGKSDEEIELSLSNNIFCFNCESIEELHVIHDIAATMKKQANVALRVNPGVNAKTHRYITTGLDENKFGIHITHLRDALDFCRNSKWINFKGLHFHIGSQITSDQPFANLCKRVNEIWKEFDIDSYGAVLLNLGGGLGVNYENPNEHLIPDFESYFNLFANNLKIPENVSVHFELGRSIVAQCGKLMTKVLYTKQGVNKAFVITDAGMTELLRPALYQSIHFIENTTSAGRPYPYDIVGPVCESSDVFAKDVMLPETSRGDILAIHTCGAYAESMMLSYNMRKPAASYFIKGDNMFPISPLLTKRPELN